MQQFLSGWINNRDPGVAPGFLRIKLLFIIHNLRVAFRVANISILADFIVKLRTIVYNKANTKTKKNQ